MVMLRKSAAEEILHTMWGEFPDAVDGAKGYLGDGPIEFVAARRAVVSWYADDFVKKFIMSISEEEVKALAAT